MTTPADIIATARLIYNDADSALYRKEDTELLGYVNEGVREISTLQPALFTTLGTYTCSVGDVEQKLTFATAQALLDVLCIHGAAALTPFDWDSMNRFNPGWRADTSGAATQWARKAGDPLRFFVYPPAPVGQVLDVMYIRNPATLALTDAITELPVGYFVALADYVVYRAELADDEFSNTQRSSAMYAAFVAKVKGA